MAGLRYERFEDDYSDTNGFASDNDDNLWGGELSARYAFTDETMAYATLIDEGTLPVFEKSVEQVPI